MVELGSEGLEYLDVWRPGLCVSEHSYSSRLRDRAVLALTAVAFRTFTFWILAFHPSALAQVWPPFQPVSSDAP